MILQLYTTTGAKIYSCLIGFFLSLVFLSVRGFSPWYAATSHLI